MTAHNVFFASDDFAYRVHYEGHAGRMNSRGFYPDMEYEVYTVSIGKDKDGDQWHDVPLEFISATCMEWINEQVAEDLAERTDQHGDAQFYPRDRDYDSEPGGVDHSYSPDL